jgi:hypothetical protein
MSRRCWCQWRRGSCRCCGPARARLPNRCRLESRCSRHRVPPAPPCKQNRREGGQKCANGLLFYRCVVVRGIGRWGWGELPCRVCMWSLSTDCSPVQRFRQCANGLLGTQPDCPQCPAPTMPLQLQLPLPAALGRTNMRNVKSCARNTSHSRSKVSAPACEQTHQLLFVPLA